MSQLIEIRATFEQPKNASEMSQHLSQLIGEYNAKCQLIQNAKVERDDQEIDLRHLSVPDLFEECSDAYWANHFIFGSRGTGKTVLANQIVSNIWKLSKKRNCFRASYCENELNQPSSDSYPIRYTVPFYRAMKQMRNFVKSIDNDESDFVALLELDSHRQTESETNRLIKCETGNEWSSTRFVATFQIPNPQFIEKYLVHSTNSMLYFHKSIEDDLLIDIYPRLIHDGQWIKNASDFVQVINRMDSRTFLVFSQIDEDFFLVKASISENN